MDFCYRRNRKIEDTKKADKAFDRVYAEKGDDGAALQELLGYVRAGDTVTIEDARELGESATEFIELALALYRKRVVLICKTPKIDTAAGYWQMVLAEITKLTAMSNQFTLNYLNDWIRCPLPYANTNMIVTEWDTDKYDEAFIADINYSPKKVETVSITGAGDYMQCVDNFNQKTALVYWTDEQEAQVTELLGLDDIEAADVDEYEIEAFMTFVSGNATNDREHTKFEYNYDKKGRNRPEDKQYDVLIHSRHYQPYICFSCPCSQ